MRGNPSLRFLENDNLRRSIVKLIPRRRTMNKTIQRHMWSCHLYQGVLFALPEKLFIFSCYEGNKLPPQLRHTWVFLRQKQRKETAPTDTHTPPRPTQLITIRPQRHAQPNHNTQHTNQDKTQKKERERERTLKRERERERRERDERGERDEREVRERERVGHERDKRARRERTQRTTHTKQTHHHHHMITPATLIT